MSDDPNNPVLLLLRAIRADAGEIKEMLREMRIPLCALESSYVALRYQLDLITGDVKQIQQRLELTEEAPLDRSERSQSSGIV